MCVLCIGAWKTFSWPHLQRVLIPQQLSMTNEKFFLKEQTCKPHRLASAVCCVEDSVAFIKATDIKWVEQRFHKLTHTNAITYQWKGTKPIQWSPRKFLSLLPSVEITGVPPLLVLLTVVLGLNLCPLAIKAGSLPTQRLVFLSSEQMVLCENKIKATQKQQKKKKKEKEISLGPCFTTDKRTLLLQYLQRKAWRKYGQFKFGKEFLTWHNLYHIKTN